MSKRIDIDAPFNDLADRLVVMIKAKLITQNHSVTGKLHDSIDTLVNTKGTPTIDIIAEDYADFVERRRGKGWAPFNPIFAWVMLSGVYRKIEKFKDNPKAFAFAVMRNKFKFGTPTPNRPDFKFKFISETIEEDATDLIEQAIDKAFFFPATIAIDNKMKIKI